MRPGLLASVVVSVGMLACSKPPSSPSSEPASLAEEPAAIESGLRWSADVLDRYMAYQQASAEAYRQRLPPAAGTGRGKDDNERLLSALKNQAEALERARKKSGLSSSELTELDQAVDLFLMQRERLTELPDSREVEKIRPRSGRLPPSLRKQIDQTLASIEDARKEAKDMPALKAQYGEAVTELLLSQEDELRKSRERVASALLSQPQ